MYRQHWEKTNIGRGEKGTVAERGNGHVRNWRWDKEQSGTCLTGAEDGLGLLIRSQGDARRVTYRAAVFGGRVSNPIGHCRYDLATAAHMDALDLAGAGVTEPLHRMALKHELNLVREWRRLFLGLSRHRFDRDFIGSKECLNVEIYLAFILCSTLK